MEYRLSCQLRILGRGKCIWKEAMLFLGGASPWDVADNNATYMCSSCCACPIMVAWYNLELSPRKHSRVAEIPNIKQNQNILRLLDFILWQCWNQRDYFSCSLESQPCFNMFRYITWWWFIDNNKLNYWTSV